MSSESKRLRLHGSTKSLLVVIIAVVAAAAAVSGVVYVTTISTPTNEKLKEQTQLVLGMTGLTAPAVKNTLDPKFVDADGDLVADPAEAGKQIDPAMLVFSYVASEESEESKGVWKDFAAALSKATGKPVEVAAFSSTEDQLRALRDGKLHVTALSTGNVPIAVNLAGFVPIAALAGEDGKANIQMEIITTADSPIRSPKDLKDRELTLTETGSNSGYRAPLELLRSQENLLPERDYKLRYSGGQTQSIEGVAEKTFEAAAVANDVLRREIAAGKIKSDQFRSVYKSESFPTAGFGYLSTLKPELAAKIRETFKSFPFKGTSVEPYFAMSAQVGFAPVNFKDDWALVRRIDDALGFKYEIREAATSAPATQP